MKLWYNPRARQEILEPPDTKFARAEAVNKVRHFHRTLPGYQPTPLVALEALAQAQGLGGIWVKDESHRLGLKAFKALGASYAVCATLAQRMDMPPPLDFSAFKQAIARAALPGGGLFAASDGNHGAAVAWMAAQLDCPSHIYLPHGTARSRQEAIRALGGEAVVIKGNYDDAVRQAARMANERKRTG